ncbi:MAG TPA: single-stranded-DNA-specific exonuclease RecJ, partial [Casimicrobiaceae bacterium]|nr:single-stranded-DNA-specific exonuclease RecJ [Casimicrobiaceae bacterium]
VIVADYDADGATACAVAVRGLRAFGAQVDFIVPNRFEYGYGLTPEIVDLAAARAPQLIVTVDNGVASVEGVAAAAARGIDVLVTDHHLPGPALPSPAIIVDPNQPGCGFPSKHIAGVGVMFYVLIALRAHLRAAGAFAGGDPPSLAPLLDLVALGTVADVVWLDHTNRVLVSQGLARIRAGHAHPGVAALFAVAGRETARATAFDLGFVAGPRLNAAGRLADMSIGIRCLIADGEHEALAHARELDRLNRERRDVEAEMHAQAIADLDLDREPTNSADDARSLCLYRATWHPGVIGIVAARLKDRLHRPVIVFARADGGELRGSGRSIPGFHLRDALDLVAKRAPGTIARFGGHAYAAGLTLPEGELPRFAATFEAVAREALTPAQLHRTVETDGPLGPGELTLTLARAMRDGVWGQGFPWPTFDGVFTVGRQRVVGERHLKVELLHGDERLDAVIFRQTDPLPDRIHAAYRPEINGWNGRESLEVVVEHWAPAE